MNRKPDFDLAAAHRYFSADCFNAAWDLIDKRSRTPEEEQMLLCAFASFYHWTMRADYTAQSRSVSLWQISRVFALLGQAENALRFAEKCRAESEASDLPPFFIGYAYEALARACKIQGNNAESRDHRETARELAEKVADAEDRQLLVKDLDALA
jgi:hypothetical protein